MGWEIGKCTSAAALRDELEGTIGELTGLTARTVRSRLRKATGNTHVSKVLEKNWPWEAEEYEDVTVKRARDLGLVSELSYITGLKRRTVERRLADAHGRTLVRNEFAARWPDPEPDFEEDDLDEEEPEYEPESANGAQAQRRSGQPDGVPARFHGRQLAERFRLGDLLGKGGFGEAYEAWDTILRRPVVLKFSDDMDTLVHEYAQVFDLSHRFICRVNLQQDSETGQRFLVMQHGGASVEVLIRRDGAFEVDVALEIVTMVAEALDFAHQSQVIHYDVSPGNILVDDKNVARLTDFGVSVAATRRITTGGNSTLMAGTARGYNHVYAAPEIHVDRARRASDQYSLALVFCAMIDGVLFNGPPRSKRRRRLTAAQNDAIARAVALDPAARYGTCVDFVQALAAEDQPSRKTRARRPGPGSKSLLS